MSSTVQAIEDAYPLSLLQQGMVFHLLRDPHLSIYHDVVTLRLQLGWNPERFGETLRFMVRKHPMLRTAFSLDGERPLQVVFVEGDAGFQTIDIRHLDA